jgi:hypothetical protein
MYSPVEPAALHVGGKTLQGVSSIMGTVGAINDTIDSIAAAPHCSSSTSSTSSTSSSQKTGGFTATVQSCVRDGAKLGAEMGVATMLVPDIVTGTGSAINGSERDLRSEGVLGMMAHTAVDVASTAGSVEGEMAGLVVGALAAPCVDEPADLAARTMYGYGVLGGSVAGAGAGILLGIPLAVARLPSIIVKNTLTAVGGLIGGLFGIGKGIIRALV